MVRIPDIKNIILKTTFFILQGIALLLLGFLPSFLFIALFIQYGSPFLNYINFLSNFKESWIAWLSAIIIIFLFFSVKRGIKVLREMKKSKRKKKKWIFISLSMVFVVGLILGQLYLYTNFILGHDILVKLSSDKNNIFFINSSEEQISFKISVTMNPFCVAECEYEFFDLSQGEVIESGTFNLTSIFSKTKIYTLNKSNVDLGSQVLNQFKLVCKGKKTPLCFTKEKEHKRTVLITLNNLLTNEEKVLLENYKEKIVSLRETSYLSRKIFEELKLNTAFVENYFLVKDYPVNFLEKKLFELEKYYFNLQELWNLQDLELLQVQVPAWEEETFSFYSTVEKYNKNLSLNFLLYNNLTEKIRISQQILEEIKSKPLQENLCFNLNKTILEFNNVVSNFNGKTYLSLKEEIIKKIYKQISMLSELVKEGEGEALCKTINLSEINYTTIFYSVIDKSIPRIILNEPFFYCCYLGECKRCCDSSCSDKYYPIIFLHGHSINGNLPADYSFDSFMEIKNNLSKEGYIDAGEFILSMEEESGFLGRINVPIMVTASYFFDSYKTDAGETISVSSKLDGIDTYAIRLRDLINSVKERTGKNKVIVIAHSMGGIVTRRYVQIFGGEDLEKIILICVPNHGISDKVKDYCAFLGSKTACNDMDEEGILINHLNNDETDSVEIHNIIGIGCDMEEETGDGIVKNSSQFLNYAQNYYIKGSCNEINFEFFHETILSPLFYPETYERIKKIL